jgi:hypothetical protein
MSTKEKISLFLLVVVYLLVTVRYFPNRPMQTLSATMSHLLESVPYIIAVTILVVSVMQKVVGEKLPRNRIARIYLTFGLIVEFFCGLHNHFSLSQSGADIVGFFLQQPARLACLLFDSHRVFALQFFNQFL